MGTFSKIEVRAKKTIHTLDKWLADLCLPLTSERGSLLSFLVHGVFDSTDDTKSGSLDPQQGVTVKMLRRLVEHFLQARYKFISPEDLGSLSNDGNYVLLTFDDGYYNNVRAVPVLEEFNVPAVFFISSDHVKLGKAFWWDVVYREFKKCGWTEEEIHRRGPDYKAWRTSEVESDLRQRFGESALLPAGDLDRPFTVAELREFASHRLVSLGNHTKDHAILTNYPTAEIREQITEGQDAIQTITGKTPKIIAYPNGNYSEEILAAAREAGLQFGLLTRAGRNRLPLNRCSAEAMTMKRFTLWGDRAVEAQCRVSRSPLSFYRLLTGTNKESINTRPTIGPSRKGKVLAGSPGS